jgi:uncharacterized protein (TIGR00297 family)
MNLIAGFVLSVGISAVAVRLRALSLSGGAAAVIVGTLSFGFGGGAVAVALIGFFLSGSVLSRIGGAHAQTARMLAHKGATRDAVQVFANGGVAAACALAAALWPSAATGWIAASIGSLIAAAADTWSTEIGVWSKALPRSIITWHVAPRGTSGAITLLGCAASIAGGAAVGVLAALFLPHRPVSLWALLGALIGFFGSSIDSLLGASVQSVWHCPACDEDCESSLHRCGAKTVLVRGLRFIDNDTVNFLTTAAGAALGWWAQSIVR